MNDGWIDVLKPRRDGLDEAYERDLQDELVETISDLRIGDMFRCRSGLLRTYDHLLVGRAMDSSMTGVLGCTWSSCSGMSLLHVGIQMIAPVHRRTGLFFELWRHYIAEVLPHETARPSLVGVKTYNPIVYLAMQVFAGLGGGRLYPDVEADEQDRGLTQLAAETSSVVAPGHRFEKTTGVVRGVGMPPDLYQAVPTVEVHPVERYFERHLRPGDRLLCLLRFPGFDEQGSAQQLFASLGIALGSVGRAGTWR